MKKRIAIIFTIAFIAFAHQAYTQNIYTKDGVNIGTKAGFINACTEGDIGKEMELNGIEVNVEGYCSCVCDNLIPTLTYNEYDSAIKANKLLELYLREDNIEILKSCFEEEYKIKDPSKYKVNGANLRPETLNLLIKECVNTVYDPNSDDFTYRDAKTYCSCLFDELYNKGYTLEDLEDLEDENSLFFNEVNLPCLMKITDNTVDNESKYSPLDIKGENLKSNIYLKEQYTNEYLIKINIDGFSKYFVFDTGASDLIIDRDLEKKLIANGTLKKENYLGSEYFEMANNEIVKADIVLIDHIIIGDYIVNNVTVAIFENATLLCGLSLLNKFKKWNFNKESKILTLYK